MNTFEDIEDEMAVEAISSGRITMKGHHSESQNDHQTARVIQKTKQGSYRDNLSRMRTDEHKMLCG